MRNEEEKKSDKGKGKEAKYLRIVPVAMVVAIVLSVSVGILPASEVCQNETYAVNDFKANASSCNESQSVNVTDALQNDIHAENENEKHSQILLFTRKAAKSKAMRNFTGNVPRYTGNQSINISNISDISKKETGIESGAGENIMTTASTDNESQGVKEETIPQYYSSYIDWGNVGGKSYTVSPPSVGRTIAVVGKMYQYQKGVAGGTGGNTTVVEELDENKTVVEIGENTTVVEETDGNATALSGPVYYLLARVIAIEGWNNPTDVNRNEWVECTMDYYDEDCTSPYTFEELDLRLKPHIWGYRVEKITINVKPMPSDVDDIRGDYDYLIVASYFYGYNGATHSSAALDEIDEEISDTITYNEVKNNLYRGGMVYDEREKTIYLIGHAQDAVSPGYHDLKAAEQGITSINQKIQAPEKLDMDHEPIIPEPAYISIAEPPQPVMKRTEVKNYGGYHNFEVTFKDTYVTKPTVGTVPVNVLALVNQGLEFYLQSQAIHSFYLYEENYNFSVEYIPDKEILFKDDFERYSVGDRIAQIYKWTDAGSYTADNWKIQSASGHGKVLGVYDPNQEYYMQQIEPQCGKDWTDYTWQGELRFAGDYNVGGTWADCRLVGLIARWDDTGAYMVIIDMDERDDDGNDYLDQNDEFWVSIWNLYDVDDDGTIEGDIKHHYDDPADEAFLLGQKRFRNNANGFAAKLLNQDWFTIKVGVDEFNINFWLDGIKVLIANDGSSYRHRSGNIGWYFSNLHCPHSGPDWQFDNVVVTKGCIFQDMFNDTAFSENNWDPLYHENKIVLEDCELVLNYSTCGEAEAKISMPQDVIIESDVKQVSSDYFASDSMGIIWYQEYGEYSVYRTDKLEVKFLYTPYPPPNKFIWIDYMGYGNGPDEVMIPFDWERGQWYNMKLVMSSLGPERYASVYVDGELMWSGTAGMIDKDLAYNDGEDHVGYLKTYFSLYSLESEGGEVRFDNVYVEDTERETLKSTNYTNYYNEGEFIFYGGDAPHGSYWLENPGRGLKFSSYNGAYGWVFNQPVLTNYTVHTKLNISNEQTQGIAYVIVNDWMVLRLKEWGSGDSVEFIREDTGGGHSGGWGTNTNVDLERDKFYDVTVHVRREDDKIIYTGYLDGKFVSRYERTSPSDVSGRAGIGACSSTIYSEYFVVESKPDCISPAASITSPGPGDTVSGTVTVETSVSDTGGSGISHSALYANDTLVAVNISSADPTFKFDTGLLPAGDCTLTVVAVDNAGNSNWTAIAITVLLPMEGDVNGDRHVTIADSILLQGYLADPAAHPLTVSQLTSANTYEIAPDASTINIYDAMYIQKWLLDPSTPLWDEEHDQGITVPPEP